MFLLFLGEIPVLEVSLPCSFPIMRPLWSSLPIKFPDQVRPALQPLQASQNRAFIGTGAFVRKGAASQNPSRPLRHGIGERSCPRSTGSDTSRSGCCSQYHRPPLSSEKVKASGASTRKSGQQPARSSSPTLKVRLNRRRSPSGTRVPSSSFPPRSPWSHTLYSPLPSDGRSASSRTLGPS